MALLEQSINSDTFMDAVSLRVGDLEGMTSYYSLILSVEPMEEKVWFCPASRRTEGIDLQPHKWSAVVGL